MINYFGSQKMEKQNRAQRFLTVSAFSLLLLLLLLLADVSILDGYGYSVRQGGSVAAGFLTAASILTTSLIVGLSDGRSVSYTGMQSSM